MPDPLPKLGTVPHSVPASNTAKHGGAACLVAHEEECELSGSGTGSRLGHTRLAGHPQRSRRIEE